MKLSELLETIKNKTTINEDWGSPDYLSNLLMELSSYYSTLGQHVADAERDTDYAESHFKVTEAQLTLEMIEQGKPVGRAEEQAKVDSREDKELYIQKKHKSRLLFLTRQNLSTTIDAIRSRLSYIKTDREASKHAV